MDEEYSFSDDEDEEEDKEQEEEEENEEEEEDTGEESGEKEEKEVEEEESKKHKWILNVIRTYHNIMNIKQYNNAVAMTTKHKLYKIWLSQLDKLFQGITCGNYGCSIIAINCCN